MPPQGINNKENSTRGMETEITKLLDKRKVIIQKLKSVEEEHKEDMVEDLATVEEEISTLSSEDNRNRVMNNFKSLANVDGSTNTMGV